MLSCIAEWHAVDYSVKAYRKKEKNIPVVHLLL